MIRFDQETNILVSGNLSFSNMGDHMRSPTSDFYGILGISKTATIKEMCKAYKSIVTKWNPDKNHSDKAEVKFQEINDAYKAINHKKMEERNTSEGSFHHKSNDESFFSRPAVLLKSLSKKNNRPPSPNPNRSCHGNTNGSYHGTINSPQPDTCQSKTNTIKSTVTLEALFDSTSSSRSKSATRRRPSETKERSRSKSTTRRDPCESTSVSGRSKSTTRRDPSESSDVSGRSKSTTRRDPAEFIDVSRSTTRRRASETEIPNMSGSVGKRSSSASNIVYSQSTARRKPAPIETKLECTLEELCFGCVKHIQIRRDIIRQGIIEKEEEIVKIKVQPGWKKGTKITFEGKGDERPGYYPADIIFCIEEISHPLFQRIGDDLEYGVEIPLVNALTGCNISIPLLGGEKMSLTFDDIIHPGYEKVIPGQGMPISKDDQEKRGNLRIQFLINFPLELTDQQRSLALSILQHCS